MRFEFQGRRYGISFTRDHKEIDVHRDGVKTRVLSKYPYTTVSLHEYTGTAAPVLVGFATVGCAPNDNYSNELGRLMALRELHRKFRLLEAVALTTNPPKTEVAAKYSKAFRSAIWTAYNNRANGPKPAEKKQEEKETVH